jgi:hypothetical protein
MEENSNPPPFNEEIAKKYIGKYVLIGISFYDSEGNFLRQEQMHGLISEVSGKFGIKVAYKGSRNGIEEWFPPNIQSLQFAKPGEYRLRETGEVINSPDLLWTWNVYQNSK